MIERGWLLLVHLFLIFPPHFYGYFGQELRIIEFETMQEPNKFSAPSAIAQCALCSEKKDDINSFIFLFLYLGTDYMLRKYSLWELQSKAAE